MSPLQRRAGDNPWVAPALLFRRVEAWELPGLFVSAQRLERDDWSSGVKPTPVYRYVDAGVRVRPVLVHCSGVAIEEPPPDWDALKPTPKITNALSLANSEFTFSNSLGLNELDFCR